MDAAKTTTKYILITGGVISCLGKGTLLASLAYVLRKATNLRIRGVKIDPYLNVDASKMNPYEHGEVFVLEDGGEVDLDLGTYERMMDCDLSSDNNITLGKSFLRLITAERAGAYMGQTVQIVPHLANQIIADIQNVAQAADICFIELGGTIGDNESFNFTEALRQLRRRVGPENFCILHATLLPSISVVGEVKTKPTQHSVKDLRSVGIIPDFIVCRCERPLTSETRAKVALFCDVPETNVIDMCNQSDIYKVPQVLIDQGVPDRVFRHLGLGTANFNIPTFPHLTSGFPTHIKIAVVGKYTRLHDSYLSLTHSLNFAAWSLGHNAYIRYIDSETPDLIEQLEDADCVIIPGGYGGRALDGKLETARYVRTTGKPFLGICLGMQIVCIEYARNVLGWSEAASQETDPATTTPLFIKNWTGEKRVGAKPISVMCGSKTNSTYGRLCISERHRHDYSFNTEYKDKLFGPDTKLTLVGTSVRQHRTSGDGQTLGEIKAALEPDVVEIVELEDHPWHVSVQFHPEFKSRPETPAPLFIGLLRATLVV